MTLVALRHHEIRYPLGPALQAPLSLSVRAGDRIAITGPSGCGKSTLLRQIAASVSGLPAGSTIALGARATNYLPQSDFLFPWYTPLQNYMAWLDRTECSMEHLHAAEALGIKEALHRSFDRLSGGERQRVGLWLLLCSESDLALIDEPFTALDLRRKIVCLEALSAWLNADRGLLLVSHDFEVITYLASEVVILPKNASQELITVKLNHTLPASREDYVERHRNQDYVHLLAAMTETPLPVAS